MRRKQAQEMRDRMRAFYESTGQKVRVEVIVYETDEGEPDYQPEVLTPVKAQRKGT